MRARITALFLTLAVSGPAFGDADPPTRAGRLSYVQGEVVMQPDARPPEDAELNHPLTLGDRLMTSRESRAELSIGTAAVRLDENTDVLIANLDQDIAQIELNSGTLGIHVRELRDSEIFEIDTPNAVVTLRRPGDYRISVDPQGATVLAVRHGEAELDGGEGAIRLADRQELRFTGVERSADVASLGPLDGFDEWSIERERTIADAEATRYVSRDVVGYEDLDRYGSWYSEPEYGHVWAPRLVIGGWSPYRFGRWKWISPWGWTWIDHAPWGFAPFHFGRWAFIRHRWCWVPGPRHHRPIYAPAHVAWKGKVPELRPVHAAVSWFPLGPREVYVPPHPASPRYLRNVNIANTVIDDHAFITNAARDRVRNRHFANRDAADAVTTIPRSAFDASHTVPARFLHANPRERANPRESARSAHPNAVPGLRVPGRRAIQSLDDRTRGRGTQLMRAPTQPPRMASQRSRNAGQQPSRSSGMGGEGRSRGAGVVRSDGQHQQSGSAGRSQSSASGGRSGRSGLRTNRH